MGEKSYGEKDEKTYIFKDVVALGNFVGKFTRRLFLTIADPVGATVAAGIAVSGGGHHGIFVGDQIVVIAIKASGGNIRWDEISLPGRQLRPVMPQKSSSMPKLAQG